MAIAIGAADLGKFHADPSAGTVAFTTTGAVSAGGHIVIGVGWFSSSATLTGVAGGGLTWTIDLQGHPTAPGASSLAIVSAPAPAGLASSTTITATFSTSVPARMIGGSWFSGVKATSPVDGTPPAIAGVDPANTAYASSSETVVAGSLLYAFTWTESGNYTSTPTAPAIEAFEIPGPASPIAGFANYRIESSAGSYTIAGTLSTTGKSATGIVAYLAEPDAATPGNRMRRFM